MVEMGTFVAILLGNVAGGLLIALPRGRRAGTWRSAAWRWRVLGRARGAVRAALAGHRTEPAHQLEPGHRDLAQPEARARQHGGVPLAAGHLVDVVLRRGVPARSSRRSPRTCCTATSRWRRCCWWCSRWASAIGSLLCETLSRRHVEIGLVPLGAIGMSVFAVDLYFASRGLPQSAAQTVGTFVATPRTGA